jgi:hypothetical protein
MTVSPHNSRMVKMVALVGGLAAALVPTAQATVMADTGGAGGELRHAGIVDLRSPDRRTPVRDWAYADAGERAVGGEVGNVGIVDLRTPDRKSPAREWAYTDAGERAVVDVRQTQPAVIDFRSADTRDAVDGRYPTAPILVASGSNGFEWGDASIGAGVALGLMLLLLMLRQFTHRKTPLPPASRISVSN